MSDDLHCHMCQREARDIHEEHLLDGKVLIKCADCGTLLAIRPDIASEGPAPTVH